MQIGEKTYANIYVLDRAQTEIITNKTNQMRSEVGINLTIQITNFEVKSKFKAKTPDRHHNAAVTKVTTAEVLREADMAHELDERLITEKLHVMPTRVPLTLCRHHRHHNGYLPIGAHQVEVGSKRNPTGTIIIG